MKKIELPKDTYTGLSVEKAIEKRRSIRAFSGKKMSLAELSHLLHYAAGITEGRYALRAAPSAGALYPIEVYPVVNNVEGLAQGIYHYSIRDHSLELLREGDFRKEMVDHSLGQWFVAEANVALMLTAVSERTRRRYGERANRYILLEVGHIAQNIYLAATSRGLGACAVGAFLDDGFNRMLGVDGVEESIIYFMVVGKVG